MEYLYPALKALALVPLTLLPIINPLSTAPVFAATAVGDRQMSRRLARQVAMNSWFVMVGAMLIGTYVLAASVAAAGAALTAAVLYFIFVHAAALLKKLGEVGTLVMMRLLAFILVCVGVEFMWTGWAALNHLPGP